MEPRPDVIVDFLFEDGNLFVSVQNIGSHPALRVHEIKPLYGSVKVAMRNPGSAGKVGEAAVHLK